MQMSAYVGPTISSYVEELGTQSCAGMGLSGRRDHAVQRAYVAAAVVCKPARRASSRARGGKCVIVRSLANVKSANIIVPYGWYYCDSWIDPPWGCPSRTHDLRCQRPELGFWVGGSDQHSVIDLARVGRARIHMGRPAGAPEVGLSSAGAVLVELAVDGFW